MCICLQEISIKEFEYMCYSTKTGSCCSPKKIEQKVYAEAGQRVYAELKPVLLFTVTFH